jgi:Ca2+-binding RTX toxin-like protein
VFKALPKGQLASSAFEIGSFTSSGNDHILYDGMTGALYYDADGSGAGKAIHIATLKGAPSLSSADFFIV